MADRNIKDRKMGREEMLRRRAQPTVVVATVMVMVLSFVFICSSEIFKAPGFLIGALIL